MRHRKRKPVFGQRSMQRRQLAAELILRGALTTTEVRAKELRPLVERLITIGKRNTVSAKRDVAKHLQNAEAARRVSSSLAKRYEKRQGGYTRITKLTPRHGDGAKRARIEFIKENGYANHNS